MENNLKYQFLQYELDETKCEVALPVIFGEESLAAFYHNINTVPYLLISIYKGSTFVVEKQITLPWEEEEPEYVLINFSKLFSPEDYRGKLQEGDIFHFRIQEPRGYSRVLNTNRFYLAKKQEGLSVVTYRCIPDAYGFPFEETEGYAVVTLPILLSKPQYGQEDATYTKSNGSIVVLFSQQRKERSGETEYFPESLHDKIVTALACDEVYINGERVTKNGSYEVEWDNYDELPDGTKTARATFRVQANTVSRNSNY